VHYFVICYPRPPESASRPSYNVICDIKYYSSKANITYTKVLLKNYLISIVQFGCKFNFSFISKNRLHFNYVCYVSCQICCKDCVRERMSSVANNSSDLEATVMDAKVCLMTLHHSPFKRHYHLLSRNSLSAFQAPFQQTWYQWRVVPLVAQTCHFNGDSLAKDFIQKYT